MGGGGNFLVPMFSTCLPSRGGRGLGSAPSGVSEEEGGGGGVAEPGPTKTKIFGLSSLLIAVPIMISSSCYRRRVIVEEPVVSEDYHNTDIQSTKEENDDVITVTHQVR